MLLFLCIFYNIDAQLHTGIDDNLLKKNSIIFRTEKYNSWVSCHAKDITTVQSPEQLSNIKAVVRSSQIQQRSLPEAFAITARKFKNRKTEKTFLKLVSQREVYISDNKSSVIVSSKKSVNIAVIITTPFKGKQSVLQHAYNRFAVYENEKFPKQPFKTVLSEWTLLSGIQIRPPPLLNTRYEKKYEFKSINSGRELL
ncbi:hypothetical protein B0A69_04930 [Chryseobacterium shigense]|uniref:Uncharacterized protein n=2 Tax=Chryseobacterium shigense TaxID=297244 RepID=A0A1N7INK7_9FLAO|nr:hypothetical protein B0A69_04930 [Chryseobacterium shigense]SIS38632.1 hypothetical protein SAMN05421639_104282 [Chryseobacterium shigense]